MTQFEAVQFVADQDDESQGDWMLKLSAFEAMPEGLVSLSFVEDQDRERESSAFVWVHAAELRAALDRIDAMMAAGRGPGSGPSARHLSPVD